MSRLPVFFVIAAASLSSIAWLSVQPDLNFEMADAGTSIAVRSESPKELEIVRVANQTAARILALDQARRLAFWALVLKSSKQACDGVVGASYTSATEPGLDQWRVVCRDGNEYSIIVEQDEKNLFCIGSAFDRSVWWRPM